MEHFNDSKSGEVSGIFSLITPEIKKRKIPHDWID